MTAAFQVTTVSQVLIGADNWRMVNIANLSDSMVYVGFSKDGAVTTSIGTPIAAGDSLSLSQPDSYAGRTDIAIIHGASGNKEVRVLAL